MARKDFAPGPIRPGRERQLADCRKRSRSGFMAHLGVLLRWPFRRECWRNMSDQDAARIAADLEWEGNPIQFDDWHSDVDMHKYTGRKIR